MQILLIATRMDNSRLHNSLHLLKEIGVDPVIVWGVEKDNLAQEVKDIIVDPGGGGLTNGEIAVALSHAKCLRHVMTSGESAIIIEDDFRLWVEGGVTADMVKPAWDSVPEDTDHECFAKWHIWNAELQSFTKGDNSNHRQVISPTYGNQCYYVSVRFAQSFYGYIFPIRVAADVIWTYPPSGSDFIFRHYYRFDDQDGLIWHSDKSIKDEVGDMTCEKLTDQ